MLEQFKRTYLNRALSKLGYCSRKIADEWIAAGRVAVNGEVILAPEHWVELGTDTIEISGVEKKASDSVHDFIYLCMHKPAGYVTTRQDELGRKTIYDLLPTEYSSQATWIFPVGRLDLESEGLLFLTNDGKWSDLLTDPKFHLEKMYRVKLDGKPFEPELERFRNGIEWDEKKTLPARVNAIAGANGWYEVGITEGRNRQIRKMFHILGYKVKRLIRVSIGTFQLNDLAEGETKVLSASWVEALRKAAMEKSQ